MTTIWDNSQKPSGIIGGWTYDEANMSYDQAYDPETGNIVYYDGIGLANAWTNLTKI